MTTHFFLCNLMAKLKFLVVTIVKTPLAVLLFITSCPSVKPTFIDVNQVPLFSIVPNCTECDFKVKEHLLHSSSFGEKKSSACDCELI